MTECTCTWTLEDHQPATRVPTLGCPVHNRAVAVVDEVWWHNGVRLQVMESFVGDACIVMWSHDLCRESGATPEFPLPQVGVAKTFGVEIAQTQHGHGRCVP
jgi:hypothetical protein